MIDKQPNNEEIIQNIVEFKQAARQWLNKLNDLNAPSQVLGCVLDIQNVLDAACTGLSAQPMASFESLQERVSILEGHFGENSNARITASPLTPTGFGTGGVSIVGLGRLH